jgi:peptide/nickel transport system substrate-binding protein
MTRLRQLLVGALSVGLGPILVSSLAIGAPAGANLVASRPVSGGSITLVGSPATLDPDTAATQFSSSPWFNLIYGQLFRVSENGALSPWLATSYTVSASGLTATLTLRHGVSFQDGTPFNAAAVEYNLNRDRLLGAPAGTVTPSAPFLNSISSISTHGSYTVVLHLLHRDNLLQDVLAESEATYIISPSAFQSEGATQFGLQPVGAGPYRVTAFVPSTTATFTRFAKYYGAKDTYLTSINLVNITNDGSELAGCAAQTVTVCSFSLTSLATSPQQAASYSDLREVDSPRVYWLRVQFNVNRPPFNNLLAREAVNYATDAAQLSSLVAGKPSPTCYMMASSNTFWNGPACPKGLPTFDLAKAQALVQQLGGLSFSVTSVSNTSMYSATMPVLQKEWQAAGMNVTLNIVPHSTELAVQGSGAYQMIAPGAGGGFIDPYLGAQPYIGAGGSQNAWGYKSAALDALAVRVETAKSPAQEKSLWNQYMQLDVQNEGNFGLLEGTTQNFVNAHLHGVVFAGYNAYYDHAWLSS